MVAVLVGEDLNAMIRAHLVGCLQRLVLRLELNALRGVKAPEFPLINSDARR